MFPLRDENPTIHTSFATYLIIGLNIAAWVYLQGMGMHEKLIQSICSYGLIPGELLGFAKAGTRVNLGEGITYVLNGSQTWLNVITSMFMHGGWFHLISNMWFLAVFGDDVEDVMGIVKFVVFYIVCGVSAAAAQMYMNPQSVIPMVGASGAISGVMGAYAILFPFVPVHVLVFFGFFFTRIVVPAIIMLGYWFLLQFLGGYMSSGVSSGGVAFWAHAGGFIAGVILCLFFMDKERVAKRRAKRGRARRMFSKG